MLWKIEKKINPWKENITTGIISLSCLLILVFFPLNQLSQKISGLLFFLFLVPYVYLRFILKKDLTKYGWQIGKWKLGALFSVISLILSIGIFFLLFYKTSFTDTYSIPLVLREKFLFFLGYELVFVFLYLVFFEFFFRGFVMFSYQKAFGFWSILLQFLLSLSFFIISGGLSFKYILIIVASFFSGIISYKSQSLIYSIIYAFLFIFLCDVLVVKLVIEY